LRAALAADGLTAGAVVSGAKGLHLYARLAPAGQDAVRGYARRLASELEARDPGRATATMAKSARRGRVLVDWSQNASAKTTAAPYTLRLTETPAVAAPVTWDEVAGCRDPADLRFSPEQALDRLQRHGDLLAGLGDPAPLPPAP
jgi:bifunctional non-homologous end joining protein LigD